MENLEVQLVYGKGIYHIYRIAFDGNAIDIINCVQSEIRDGKIYFDLKAKDKDYKLYLDLIDGKFKF